MDTPDVIDSVAALSPGSPVAALRRQRAEIARRSQTSHDAALLPRDPGGLGFGERAALAERIARIWRDSALAEHYRGLLESSGATSEIGMMADPDAPPAASSRPRALTRHVDLVSRTPELATRDDIAALLAVGLSERDVVSLAGLIAFVNYQVRVIAGLRLLRGA